MRKRPIRSDVAEFINNAVADKITTSYEDSEIFLMLSKIKWPINGEKFHAPNTEGSTLRKDLNIALKEHEWNALDKHVGSIGISKLQWVKHAIFKLMDEERKSCLKQSINGNSF